MVLWGQAKFKWPLLMDDALLFMTSALTTISNFFLVLQSFAYVSGLTVFSFRLHSHDRTGIARRSVVFFR